MVDEIHKITLAGGLELWQNVPLDSLREQDKNARVMPPPLFNQLVANIRKRNGLESLPLCALINGNVEIISGHHRVRAARAAGLAATHAIVDTTNLSRSQIIAKQLAHNSIQGYDNKDVLAELYLTMTEVADLEESAIAADELRHEIARLSDDPNALLAPPAPGIEVDLPFRLISLMFLPSTFVRWETIEATIKRTNGDDITGALPIETYERFVTTCRKVGMKHEIRSLGSIVAKMLDIVEQYIQS